MPSTLYNTRQDLAQQGKTTDNITHRRYFHNIICVRSQKQALNKRAFIDTSCGNRGLNTLRPRQDGRHFSDDIFKCIFLNENVWISLKIWLKFVPRVPINNISAMVQIMAWRRSGDKPLSEPMMISLLTHICVTRPQWVSTARVRYICASGICHHWFR